MRLQNRQVSLLKP